MTQSSFSFPLDQTYKSEDFLALAENIEAKNLLEKFFSQKDFTKSKFPSLILQGEEASGKTHLLNIFAKKNNVSQSISMKEIGKLKNE